MAESTKSVCSNCQSFKQIDELSGSCINSKFHVGYEGAFVDYDAKREVGLTAIYPDMVQVEADEGWGFYVGKDFGCIHFEISI